VIEIERTRNANRRIRLLAALQEYALPMLPPEPQPEVELLAEASAIGAHHRTAYPRRKRDLSFNAISDQFNREG